MKLKKEELIKSPLNYTGGKYKLLPQILPLLPSNINTFYDVFCGGTEVGINSRAIKIISNDVLNPIIELYDYFLNNSVDNIIYKIDECIHKYNLSETSKYGYEFYNCDSNKGVGSYNKNRYLSLRKDYNDGARNPITFYTMVLFAFNNMIRFNDKNEFNVAVNKRDFNNNVKKNLIRYISHIQKLNIEFLNKDFREFENMTTSNDFIYCDPPYLITNANYNERSGWTEQDEIDLLNFLDKSDKQNVRFALSNVLEHKGKSNELLKEWSKKHNVHILNSNYGNCNYQTKDKSKDSTVEVLITNY